MNETVLLPCPFCGGEGGFFQVPLVDGDANAGGEGVQCTEPRCPASTRLWFFEKHDGKPEMAEAWNRRVAPASTEREPLKGEQWPEGVSDGLSMPCQVCGQSPRFDYTVTNECWHDVAPPKMRLGVICLPCLDRLAAQKNYDVARSLVHVQWTGIGVTVVLYPAHIHRYAAERGPVAPPPEEGTP